MITKVQNYIMRTLDKEYRQLLKLSKQPRYTIGKFMLDDKILSFPDGRSFAFIYKELFKKQIYKFKCQSSEPLIIDCGANIGLSIIYFKKLFPQSHVIAFEPEKAIFGYLQQNLASFDLTDVELYRKALWKEDGFIQFSNEGADASRISVSAAEDGFIGSYKVECVRLSHFLKTKIDFLKLDIEGAELEVLKEIEPCIKSVEHLFIEYHSFEKRLQELQELLSILTRNGFRYFIDSPLSVTNTPFLRDASWLGVEFYLNIYATNIFI